MLVAGLMMENVSFDEEADHSLSLAVFSVMYLRTKIAHVHEKAGRKLALAQRRHRYGREAAHSSES